jgi:hypothetical protein
MKITKGLTLLKYIAEDAPLIPVKVEKVGTKFLYLSEDKTGVNKFQRKFLKKTLKESGYGKTRLFLTHKDHQKWILSQDCKAELRKLFYAWQVVENLTLEESKEIISMLKKSKERYEKRMSKYK